MPKHRKPKVQAKAPTPSIPAPPSLPSIPEGMSDTYWEAMSPLTAEQIKRVPSEMRCPKCRELLWEGGPPTVKELPIECLDCNRLYTLGDLLKVVMP